MLDEGGVQIEARPDESMKLRIKFYIVQLGCCCLPHTDNVSTEYGVKSKWPMASATPTNKTILFKLLSLF